MIIILYIDSPYQTKYPHASLLATSSNLAMAGGAGALGGGKGGKSKRTASSLRLQDNSSVLGDGATGNQQYYFLSGKFFTNLVKKKKDREYLCVGKSNLVLYFELIAIKKFLLLMEANMLLVLHSRSCAYMMPYLW